jgi:hypothetical protein
VEWKCITRAVSGACHRSAIKSSSSRDARFRSIRGVCGRESFVLNFSGGFDFLTLREGFVHV